MLFSPTFSVRVNSIPETKAAQAAELATTLYQVQHYTGGNAFLGPSANWKRVALFCSTYIAQVLNVGEHRLPGKAHPDAQVWSMARDYAQGHASHLTGLTGHKIEPRKAEPAKSIEDELSSLADEVTR